MCVLLACLAGVAHAQDVAPAFASFDDFARRYREAPEAGRAELFHALVADRRAHGGFPIVEPGDGGVVFVYAGRGDEKTVEVIGDFRTRSHNSVMWNNRGLPLARLVAGGPVFFARMPVEPDARLDYQLAVDGKYLIADGRIEPLIAVMIDSAADRSDWYQLHSAYAAYLDQVVAFVDAHYPTRARAQDRLHAGSSAGGRATLSIALDRPALFARFAMFSPSLFGSPHDYEPLLAGKQRLGRDARIFLSAGSYEGYILDDAHLFERVLRRAGAHVRTAYTHEGHSFGATRNLVPEMLAWMFPPARRGAGPPK